MIRVERGPAPEFVHEDEFLKARESYERFKAEGGSRLKQTSMDFTSALGPYLTRAAEYSYELFNYKCAYTEVVVSPQLHLHRPEGDAYDDRLGGAPNHYWWTAFWYRNWYHASADVASLKRVLFPVLDSRAAEPDLGQVPFGDELPEDLLDDGVLLDPCEDHPQLHLQFTADGQVRSWAEQSAPWLNQKTARRGPETIKLLALNTPPLVAMRLDAIRSAIDFVNASPVEMQRLLEVTAPHIGAVRQVAAAQQVVRPSKKLTPLLRTLAPELVPLILAEPSRFSDDFVVGVRAALRDSAPGLARMLEMPTAELRGAEPEALPSGTPAEEPPAAPAKVIPLTAAIKSILIKNFQAIDFYELEVPPGIAVEPGEPLQPAVISTTLPSVERKTAGPPKRPWRVFLGENGSGKSSVLRALALALAGDQVVKLAKDSRLDWKDLLRRGTTEGQVRLEFTGGEVIDLEFTAKGPTAASRARLPRIDGFVRGFGATRLNSNPKTAPNQNVRLGNLFDPMQPALDAEKWLVELEKRDDRRDFNVAAITIAKLLQQEHLVAETGDPKSVDYLRRKDEEILVDNEPLRILSDGYRAIITLACDLMAASGGGLDNMKSAYGIVLIDELGSYLHPRWKMHITGALREEFASMQFFVTTHEPLCLRGLVEREVVLVTRSSYEPNAVWNAVLETSEESPKKFRVDQLLTSAFFGLSATIDPDVEKEFAEYYKLLRKVDPTADDHRERDLLRARLSKYGILGYTARDQLVYDAIDKYLATSSTSTPEKRREDRDKTMKKVVDIWLNVAAQREAAAQT